MVACRPGEHLWSASCRCKNKTYHSHMCLRQQPWVHALCEVNSGGYSGLAAAAAASVAPLKPEPDATDVVSVPDTLAPGQGYGVAVPDTLAPGQTCGVVPATPGCLPPEWAQGAAGPAPGGLAQGVTGFPPGFHAAGAAPAAAALPHGHAPGSRVGFGHGLQGQDPACRVDVPRTPQQPQQGPLYIASTAPVGSGPSPVSHPAAGPAGDGRWEGRVDANGVPIAWKIEQARRKREAAAAAAAAAQRAEQAQVLRDSKWDTQVRPASPICRFNVALCLHLHAKVVEQARLLRTIKVDTPVGPVPKAWEKDCAPLHLHSAPPGPQEMLVATA